MNPLDTSETSEIMKILEELEDETLAVELLKEFNNKTAKLGKLLMNLNQDKSNEDWKIECDQAKKDVDQIILKIRELG